MKPVIFFDIDGVLADFVYGAMLMHGRADIPYETIRWGLEEQFGIEPNVFWSKLDRCFWGNLRPYKDGFNLLQQAEDMVGPDRIGLLTSAAGEPGCIDGKRDWVFEHLRSYSMRLFTGNDKRLFAGPTKILVDDRDENVQMFAAAGGLTVHVPRPWNLRRGDTIGGGRFSVPQVRDELAEAVRLASR